MTWFCEATAKRGGRNQRTVQPFRGYRFTLYLTGTLPSLLRVRGENAVTIRATSETMGLKRDLDPVEQQQQPHDPNHGMCGLLHHSCNRDASGRGLEVQASHVENLDGIAFAFEGPWAGLYVWTPLRRSSERSLNKAAHA